MNRYRLLLAGIVLMCCAAVASEGTAPAPLAMETEYAVLRHAIWNGDGTDRVTWRFQTVQDDGGTAPGASREAPGLRLLDRETSPTTRAVWPWALFAIAVAGLVLLTNRARQHGRVVAVRARRRPPPVPRRRGG